MVVRYAYDAWGNMISTTGTMSGSLGRINPFRYRGYYYDVETGYYYLQARYYNPSIGRFISPDPVLDTNSAVGLNLYAYCGNDPVNQIDYSGENSTSFFDYWGQCWSDICGFIETTVAETVECLKALIPGYSVCGGLVIADGPLPIGDTIALVGVVLLTIGAVGYGVYQAIQTPSVPAKKQKKK